MEEQGAMIKELQLMLWQKLIKPFQLTLADNRPCVFVLEPIISRWALPAFVQTPLVF